MRVPSDLVQTYNVHTNGQWTIPVDFRQSLTANILKRVSTTFLFNFTRNGPRVIK